jgi:hypothetical protein
MTCPDPELCVRLKQHIHGRRKQIWDGAVLTPVQCSLYRAKWLRDAGLGEAVERTSPCLHLGETLREDGKAMTRGCGGCRKPKLVVHRCDAGHGEVTGAECKTCGDYRPFDVFDRVVVVSLKRRADRLAEFQETLRDWPFKKPEVFEAVDGNVVPSPTNWISGGPAWGCCASHVEVLRKAIQDGVGSLLVLEDDACVRHSFRDDARRFLRDVPGDWEGLMLGGQHMVQPEKNGRCINTQRTHAYAVRGQYMRDLYRLWLRCDRHIDHVMGPQQKDRRVYAPNPFLFGQRRGLSDITCSENPIKFWQPPKGDEPVLVLLCDRAEVQRIRERGVHTGHRRGADDIDVGLTSPLTEAKLRRWISDLQWECVSEGTTLGVWHPEATLDLVQRCWNGPCRVVTRVEEL